jgi:hypothetical protein
MLPTPSVGEFGQVELGGDVVGALVVGGGPLVVGGGDVVTGGRVVAGGVVVTGGRVVVVTAVLGTDDVGELPPPPPLVNARATNTIKASTMTTTIAATSSRILRDRASSSGVGPAVSTGPPASTGAPATGIPVGAAWRDIACVASYAPGAAVGSSTTSPVMASSP